MLKSVLFIGGITTGLYLGIYLRERGWGSGLTRAYYAYKNEDYFTRRGEAKSVTIENFAEMQAKGLLDGADYNKLKQVIHGHRNELMDELITNDIEKIFENDPMLKQMKSEYKAINNK